MRSLIVLLLAVVPAFAQKQFGFDNKKSSGQDYLSPAETVKRMKVPAEFEVKLFAGEPDIVNPVAFTIDERGRLWVVECFEYPSKTPPGKAPRDRIVILEDTDGDGACDKRTVFMEGKDFPVSEERKKAGLGAFDLATGIEVGHGGVWFGAAPYLYFIENKNDKPGEIKTILSGLGSQDTHELLNTFQWGPDGWLYGLHGIYTQSKVKSGDQPEVAMNAAVWRLHPKTHKFEIFAEGTSNPWGLDWRNTDGQFILACCVIPHLYHMVPGGIYKRQGGTSYNPYAYDLIQEISDHTFHKESGWAHAGLVSLDVPHMPERFRNSVIFGSIHGCSVKQNILKPNGSSYTASRGDDFLTSGDKNVRPINLRWGPHGDIYMIDWHDQNPCHQAAAGSWDYERGRVYRIQLKDRKGGKAEDLGKNTSKELADIVKGSNDPWTYRTAMRMLFSESLKALDKEPNPVPSPKLSEFQDYVVKLVDNSAKQSFRDCLLSTSIRMNIGGNVDTFEKPEVVAWWIRQDDTLRNLSDEKAIQFNKTLKDQVDSFIQRKSPQIERDLASLAVLSQVELSRMICHSLMQNKENSKDPLIPNLVWIAYEKVLASGGRQPPVKDSSTGGLHPPLADEFKFLAEQSPSNIFVRDSIVPKVMRRLVASGKADDLALCLKFLGDVKDTNSREKALDGLVLAYKGQTVAPPKEWASLQDDLRKDAKLVPLVNKLAVNFRDPAALARAFETVGDAAKSVDDRIEALRQLVLLKHPQAYQVVAAMLYADKELPLRAEAGRQLANLTELLVGSDVVGNWAKIVPEIRPEVVNSLTSRKEWAKALLTAMAEKKIERTALTDNTVLKMQAFNDKDLNALIEKAWGRTRPTPAELTKLIDATREKLDESPASFARGKAVFEAQCVKCHKFDGRGVEVGPPLDGAGRDIEYLLANVIDPNRVIGAPYFLRTVNTLDGRIEQGLLAEEDENSITLKVENAQLKKYLKKDLDGPIKITEKSMMPEGLTAAMTPQNFRDLIRYVMAHPFLSNATVNAKPLNAGVTGRISLPMAKEITIQAEFTAADAFKTKLLVGSANGFTVKLDGKPIGQGSGSGKAMRIDGESIDLELTKGKHTLTVSTGNTTADAAMYLRFLDPDRKLSYAE